MVVLKKKFNVNKFKSQLQRQRISCQLCVNQGQQNCQRVGKLRVAQRQSTQKFVDKPIFWSTQSTNVNAKVNS